MTEVAPRSRDPKPPRSVLVIKPSSLGDVVHTLPVVAALKRTFPSSRITWLINPEWAPLLHGNTSVDETILFPRHDFRRVKRWPAVFRWALLLRRLQPDVVCDFQGLLRSGLLAQWSNPRRVWGLSDAREGAALFYNDIADVSRREHSVLRYLRLGQSLGVAEDCSVEFPLPPGKKPASLTLDQPFVLLHPFSRGLGKSMGADEVTAFCRTMAPHPVVLVGTFSGSLLPELSHCINLLNRTTLHELIWLARAAAFMVSVDSGPMHIGAAVSERLLSIHTWSDPLLVGPFNPSAWIWKNKEILRAGDYGKETGGASQRADSIVDVANFVREALRLPNS